MKNKNLDILNPEHLRLIIGDVESNDNKTRKLHAWKAFNCLEGNQKQYVEEKLQALYPRTHDKFRIGDILITKKVIGKIAKAYKNTPKRNLENDQQTEDLETIYNEFKFDRAFKEFDKIFNLHKYSCMWLKYLNDEKEYALQALAPYEYDLVRDEVTGKPLIFILSYPDTSTTGGSKFADGVETVTAESQADSSAQSKLYSIWSDTHFVKIRVRTERTDEGSKLKVEILINEENLENKNEAGVLPIVFLSNDTSVDFPIPNNLSDQSIAWNVGFSDYKTASASQGHGILTYSYPDGQKKQQTLRTGMHTAIDLPQSANPNAPETKAEYINANPNLGDQLEGLKFEAANILDDHGIKAGSSLQGQDAESFSSGFDRLLASADVQDIIEDNQTLYADVEQDVFTLVATFENELNKKTFKIDQELSTTYEKPKVLISDKETLGNIEQRERLGTLLPWQKHQILDPNLSEENAKKLEEEIQAFKKKALAENAELFDDGVDDNEDEDEGKKTP